MKNKLILLALVIGLTIVSQTSLSLGMGKIQVYSALNEPLRSSIDLITNADEGLENLEVRLASSEDYQKVGLDKSFVPANIMVAFDEENPFQINVTSNGPVTEPIVSLLLDVNWSNGRILREFTILLDPPLYDSSNVDVQVNSVVVEPIANEVIVEPVVEEPIVEPVAVETETPTTVTYTNEDVADYQEPAVVEPQVDNSNYNDEVTVAAGDTLWSIANSNKVGDLTTHQMVMAIYNANPNAFIDNNINQLIKGSRLSMPSSDEARSIGYSEALAQVRSHNQSWSPATQSYDSFQTETTQDDSYEAPTNNLDYGVQLSGSDAGDSDNGQSNTDEINAETAMAVEEDILTTDAENTELKERISQLEEIVDQQQEVLEIADDGLANLESQLANTADDTVENAETVVTDAVDDVWDTGDDTQSSDDGSIDELNLTVEDVSSNADEGQNIGDFEATTDTTDVSDSAQADAVEETKPPVVVTRKPEPSFLEKSMNWLMGNLMWVLIGLGVLFALIFVPRLLSGSDEEEDETSFLDDIKNRKRDSEEVEDTVDTKLNQPLVEDEVSESEEVEDDVLAELDRSIDFEDDGESESEANTEAHSEFDFDDQIDEEEIDLDAQDDDGFDLDGFLNEDDDNNDISDTVDHSETLAGVDFDAEDTDDKDAVEDLSVDEALDDFDLDDFELDEDISESADAAVAELAEEADDVIEDLEEELDSEVEAMVEDANEAANESDDEDFSFDDDEAFDFDLDEELEELETAEDIPLSETVDDVIENLEEEAESTEEEFNDVLDLSDEESEDEFVTMDEDDAMDDEIDLGLEDLMEDSDAIATKLDLAKAYIDMGDSDGAKNLLDEVFAEGNEEQIAEAKKLLDNN